MPKRYGSAIVSGIINKQIAKLELEARRTAPTVLPAISRAHEETTRDENSRSQSVLSTIPEEPEVVQDESPNTSARPPTFKYKYTLDDLSGSLECEKRNGDTVVLIKEVHEELAKHVKYIDDSFFDNMAGENVYVRLNLGDGFTACMRSPYWVLNIFKDGLALSLTWRDWDMMARHILPTKLCEPLGVSNLQMIITAGSNNEEEDMIITDNENRLLRLHRDQWVELFNYGSASIDMNFREISNGNQVNYRKRVPGRVLASLQSPYWVLNVRQQYEIDSNHDMPGHGIGLRLGEWNALMRIIRAKLSIILYNV